MTDLIYTTTQTFSLFHGFIISQFIKNSSTVWASQVTQWLRIHLPRQEMWVQSLGQEVSLEEEMTTHSSILAGIIPETEEPGGLQSMVFHFIFYFFIIFFNFSILYWFYHTSTCICHRCTRVPHPERPSHFPSHTLPLGHPSAPAPSFLYPASNLDWRFVSYMILCMF